MFCLLMLLVAILQLELLQTNNALPVSIKSALTVLIEFEEEHGFQRTKLKGGRLFTGTDFLLIGLHNVLLFNCIVLSFLSIIFPHMQYTFSALLNNPEQVHHGLRVIQSMLIFYTGRSMSLVIELFALPALALFGPWINLLRQLQ
ncbi:unnamed protein product [Allacma fusca]|uniref:Uncharacterized protein n=1 Tax=Allacma fusca TaxID=39272 RepID=A0A8J2P4S4_9HEXA|nr:unnamed protein product [Allacma fusca]